MNEKIIVEIFKELAVLRGDRTAEGQWLNDNPWIIQKTLADAISMVEKAKSQAE
ncbi:hypothetical protein [Nioella ostreopsis]|uniref:hypothetical protein n=1 Tax=Nioella ostreopsis TaxID=2448479 RepID=UPI0013DECCD0|nr:hypothetical protein [Nioella ostreopsis]